MFEKNLRHGMNGIRWLRKLQGFEKENVLSYKYIIDMKCYSKIVIEKLVLSIIKLSMKNIFMKTNVSV